MPEASIVIKAEDRYSATLKTLSTVTKNFDKNSEHLEQTLHTLSGEKSVLKAQTDNARKAMLEAQKQFAKTGDAADALKASLAGQEFEDLQRKLKAVNKTMKETEHQLWNVEDAAGRAGENAGGGFSKRLMSALAINGIGDAAKALLQDGANTIAGSMLGNEGGTIFSSALATAMSGGQAGFLIGGPTGAAIGAAIGGMVGASSGILQNYQVKDDAFKTYYAGLYEQSGQGVAEGVSAGSTIAGSREQNLLAFTKRFGGQAEAAAYLDRVKEMAQDTNYSYDEIVGYSKKLLNSYDPEEVFGVLQRLSDASAGLDLSSSDVDVFISGLSRMRTTGKATQEYLNYFSERGVDVYQALSGALGVDKSQVAGMVTKGQVSGSTAAQAILDYIQQSFGGLSTTLAGTYNAMADNLEDAMANVNEAFGKGYNEVRTEGIRAEQDAYGGALGDALADMNRIIGEGQGIAENLKERYQREALSALALGEKTTVFGDEQADRLMDLHGQYTNLMEQYQAASEEDKAAIGAEISALKQQAEAMAQAGYDASQVSQDLQAVELDLIDAIRANTQALGSAGWGAEYRQSQALSKGLGAGILGTPGGLENGVSTYSQRRYGGRYDVETGTWHRYAVGLGRVPYDEFPALLHEGERVLTAREARRHDAGIQGGVTVTVGTLVVREEADVDRVAAELWENIRRADQAGTY